MALKSWCLLSLLTLLIFIEDSLSFGPALRSTRQFCNSRAFLSSKLKKMPTVSTFTMMSGGVVLDSSEFDKGDANPVKSQQSLDALVPRTEITALIKQASDFEGVLQCLFHVGVFVLGATLTILADSVKIQPLWYLGMFVMSLITSFNFMALHETVHRSAFKTKWMNFVVMNIAGFLTLRPALHYFYYHWGHHKFTGDPENDSELQPSALDMDISTIPGYLLYISGIPFWFDATTTTIFHALGRVQPHEKYLASPRARREVFTEARVYLALYIAIAAGAVLAGPTGPAAALVRFWVLPSVLGQPMLRFYLFSEHRGCRNVPDDIVANTRTTWAHPLYRKMAWQMPFHREHHAWPYVPFHKLPAAHRLLEAALASSRAAAAAAGQTPASGPAAASGCQPAGESGYFGVNWAFLRKLLPRKGEVLPSASA